MWAVRMWHVYLLFLVKAFLVTVWYAESSGVENVCNLEAAENALDLSPTGTLPVKRRRAEVHVNVHSCSACQISLRASGYCRATLGPWN